MISYFSEDEISSLFEESNCCGAKILGEFGENGQEGYCAACGEPCIRQPIPDKVEALERQMKAVNYLMRPK